MRANRNGLSELTCRDRSELRWGGILVAAFLPLIALSLLKVPRIALDNFTDSVFYLSYSRQFSELVFRNGFHYYATRFGGILPDAWSGRLFGNIGGVWILRWMLASLVSLSLFLFFRKRYGLLAGLIASLLWCFNPVALRLSCTTYVDSTAVPFLIIGCCLFGSLSSDICGALLAGVLFALASSAHLYATFALVLLIPFLVGSNWGSREGLLKTSLWTIAGFLVTWFLGWLWYAWIWKMPALLSPTIDLLRDLGNGQAAQWKKPTLLALREAPAWFAPVVLLPIFCTTAWKGSPLMRGAACSLLASTLFFWSGDLFGEAYVLSMPFYYSFLLPVTVLATASACGEIAKCQATVSVRILVVFQLIFVILLTVVMVRWKPSVWLVAAASMAWLGTLVVAWARISSRLLLLAFLTSLFASNFVTAKTSIFSQMLGHYEAKDAPVLEIASKLMRLIPGARSDQATTRFWYDDEPGNPCGVERRMVGAFWLHYFARLTGKNGDYIPFGVLDDGRARAIRENGPDRIVIFDQDPQKVDEAIFTISDKRLPYAVSRQEELRATTDSSRSMTVAILERSPVASDNIPCFKASWHQTNRGKILSSHGDETEFLSSRIKWWEPMAEAGLGALHRGDRIVVPYTVHSGRVRFGLGKKGQEPLIKIEKWPSDSEAVLEMSMPEDVNDAVVSLCNRYPSGSSSQIRVRDVLVFKEGINP